MADPFGPKWARHTMRTGNIPVCATLKFPAGAVLARRCEVTGLLASPHTDLKGKSEFLAKNRLQCEYINNPEMRQKVDLPKKSRMGACQKSGDFLTLHVMHSHFQRPPCPLSC